MSTTFDTSLGALLPKQYELVHDVIVEVPPMGAYSAEVANRIDEELKAYLRINRIGRSRMEMMFRMPRPDDPRRIRRPDVVFVSFDRWPEDRVISYRGNPMDVIPDLCIEVASPSDSGDELIKKAQEYLTAGVRRVWLIYPASQTVMTFASLSEVQSFPAGTDLTDESLFPGLRIPVALMFPPVTDLPVLTDDPPLA